MLDPWDAGIKTPAPESEKDVWDRFNMLVGERNRKMIESSDGILAVLDGADVDSGTASEIGYAFALGKRIFGYRGDFRLAGDTPGSTVNLHVGYFTRKSATFRVRLTDDNMYEPDGDVVAGIYNDPYGTYEVNLNRNYLVNVRIKDYDEPTIVNLTNFGSDSVKEGEDNHRACVPKPSDAVSNTSAVNTGTEICGQSTAETEKDSSV